MKIGINLVMTIALVMAAMVVTAFLLVACPKLEFDAGDNGWPDKYSASVIELLNGARTPDEFECAAFNGVRDCSNWSSTVDAMLHDLTPDSQQKLARNAILLGLSYLVFIFVGCANFIRSSMNGQHVFESFVNTWMPAAFFFWILMPPALAYALNLLLA